MIKITNWSAKRAGAGITIAGVSVETQKIIKLVDMKEIYLGAIDGKRSVIAVSRDGETYNLLVNPS